MLTLQVKRSDIENFASGKLEPDEFRKKARIAVYAGSSGGGPVVGGFGGYGGGGYGGAVYGTGIPR